MFNPVKPVNVHINSNLQKTLNERDNGILCTAHQTNSHTEISIPHWHHHKHICTIEHRSAKSSDQVYEWMCRFLCQTNPNVNGFYFNWSWWLSSTYNSRQPFSIVTIKLNFYRVIRLTIHFMVAKNAAKCANQTLAIVDGPRKTKTIATQRKCELVEMVMWRINENPHHSKSSLTNNIIMIICRSSLSNDEVIPFFFQLLRKTFGCVNVCASICVACVMIFFILDFIIRL